MHHCAFCTYRCQAQVRQRWGFSIAEQPISRPMGTTNPLKIWLVLVIRVVNTPNLGMPFMIETNNHQTAALHVQKQNLQPAEIFQLPQHFAA